MYSRWSNLVIVVFWLATMTWLVVAKVLPPLLVGEPPNYHEILASQDDRGPVTWKLLWNDQPIGWATSRVQRSASGLTQIESRVHFASLPLAELVPGWLGAMVRLPGETPENADMDTQSTLDIDPLGRLVGFESSVRTASLPETLSMRGTVEGSQLKLVVRSGGFTYTPAPVYLPQDALVGDALSPQTRLPKLHVGQTWTVPVYSPFRPPRSPLEILQATVDRDERITWNGQKVNAWLVVYNSDPGAGLDSAKSPRGKLWVRHDGTVLKQELMILSSRLSFVRMPSGSVVPSHD